MAELLFEIFCEEIPARMQVRAGADLSNGLKKAGLTVEGIEVMTGPRRLVFVADVPLRSPDVSEERKGPRVGSPEKALAGFLRGAGLSDVSEAEIRTDPKKGEFYVAVMNSEGRDTKDILAELIPDIMNNFPWPKSMKSGGATFRWVRPLQSMMCLLEGNIVPFEVGGVQTGNITEGHRRLGKGPFKINGLKDYVESVETKGHVVLSRDKRKELIISAARSACADKGLELVEDEGLLNEVAGLAEWPVVILGDMDPSFLELPGEVIRLSMRTHQKYFAVRDPKTKALAPHFIVVANQVAQDGGKAIAAGNSRVLSARLADAQFFQSEDAKLKLEDYYEKLDTVVFHKKLGSIKDKAERVAALARELAPKVGADPDLAEKAARLAKCDLVTNMVIEFTSLEGQIGRLMYERESQFTTAHPAEKRDPSPEGSKNTKVQEMDPDFRRDEWKKELSSAKHESIALAIEEHYKPKGPSDAVPTNPVAVAVALADKFDTLVGFWVVDEKPTGSKDPFALRRAALGIVRIMIENNVRLKMTAPLVFAFMGHKIWKEDISLEQKTNSFGFILASISDSLSGKGAVGSWINRLVEQKDVAKFVEYEMSGLITQMQSLMDFLSERLKFSLRDNSVRYDLIDAIFALEGDDLVSIVNRVNALQSFLATEDGENLLAGYKRAANILKAEHKKGALPDGKPIRPSDEYGAALYDALETSSVSISAALESEDYEKAMFALAELRAPIDAFFTHTQIISDDTAVKENNLRLLGLIRDTSRQVADFEKISG